MAFARCLALDRVGSMMEARMPIIAMTTNSSMSVNPAVFVFLFMSTVHRVGTGFSYNINFLLIVRK